MITLTCLQCGLEYKALSRLNGHSKPRRFCSWACASANRRGPNHPLYIDGRKKVGPYFRVLNHQHPNKDSISRVAEHRLVAECALGKPLPITAVVHHIDHDPENNDPSNLIICENESYHILLHARERRMQTAGGLDKKLCPRCLIVKSAADFPVSRYRWDGRAGICRICQAAANKQSKLKKLGILP